MDNFDNLFVIPQQIQDKMCYNCLKTLAGEIMQIDDKMLEKLEKLSAFTIPEQNRNEFKEQLGKIVDFVEVLNELNLDNIEATISTISGGTPFREDIPNESDVIDTILKFAPKKEDRYFEVPKIIE